LRLLAALAGSAAALALVAGCGTGSGKSEPTTPTNTTSIAANTAYERSYTDCASRRLVDLAHQYKAKQNKEAVATAVGKYWANRSGGGADAEAAGKTGCEDGFPLAPK
jgi:hypothetical protein